MQLESGKPIEILLVEDNPADVRLTQEALADSKVRTSMQVCTDGEQAMDLLHRRGAYEGAPRPDLVLLDLNLPRKDGREVLAEMKADPDLRSIPVVVLTTSQADEDVLRSYDLNAACFVTKPVGLDAFLSVIRVIEDFWLTVVRLPPRG